MTAANLASIQRGVVFLMANWSAGAQWALPKLVSFLEQHDIPSEHLQVLDLDQHPELYDLPELAGKIHGWGEVLVIKHGRVAFFVRLGHDQSLIQQHCNELLQIYAA